MKKEEPSVDSSRGNPCEQVGLDRSGGRRLGDHRFIVPTGTSRDGAHREACLESILWVFDGRGDRRSQRRCRLPDITRSFGLSPSSNRRMRSRMYGGVGAGRGNPPGYPMYARHGRDFVGCKSPVRDWESQGAQYTKCPLRLAKY
jgi:hypothetical protein